MLSTAYALSVRATSPTVTDPQSSIVVAKSKTTNKIVSVFLLLLVVDIAVMIFAIYAIIKCSEFKQWPSYVPILLVLAMIMLPGVGWVIAVGAIIYYFASGCHSQPKLAFSFY